MSRYLAICSYDGTNFLGFQKQLEGRTVQNVLEDALSQLLNKETLITASGRTDAKVHALAQPFHFDCDKDIDLDKFRYSLNRVLPKDIHISSLNKVEDDFHARINAKEKHYRYIVNVGESNPFEINYVYDLNRNLDLESMIKASLLLIGEHNFMNFTSKEEDFKGFVRNIRNITIVKQNNKIIFDFYGDGFMRYMIRMIVGTLIEIGLGKINDSFIKENIDTTKRSIISYKAPGNGLYLVEVTY